MTDKQIVFTQPDRVELKEFDFDAGKLAPNGIAIKNHYSLISPGTELACLSGTEGWARLPFMPGYSGCGEVIAVGEAVRKYKPGDIVFAYTKHASRVTASNLIAHVPAGFDEKLATFVRMAAVGITALRVSNAELGDHVAVIGLGLVGNLCAQLFQLSGCEAIGIDLSAKRVELAKKCGVSHVINASEQDVKAAVEEITKGRMCEVVVEAIGLSPVAEKAAELAGKLGEVILLGSPRAEHTSNVTPLLQSIHLWSHGCVSFKGAHEWRYPNEHNPSGHVKHSIERNIEILFRLMVDGRLHTEELLTHVMSPEECAKAYAGLQNKKDEYMGVVFDWNKL